MNNSTIDELNNRTLDPCLFSIIVIPTEIYIKESEGFSNKKSVYLFFSCNINAKRKYLTSVFADDFTKTSDWYDLLLSLKSRGLSVLLYAVIPDNDYFSKALKLAFNEVTIFISCFEAISKLSKYYSYGYSKSITDKVRKVFLSSSIKEYELALSEFNDAYLGFSFICDILDDDLKRAKNYYVFPFPLRRFIFSFYFVREISKRISSLSHSKPFFYSLDEFISLFIPYFQKLESRMFCPKSELNNVINIIYNDKKDLILSYLWCIIFINQGVDYYYE